MRKKQIDIPTTELIPIPHNKFCDNCRNKDVRILQDNINLLYQTVSAIAETLKIETTDISSKCKKLKEWAKKQSQITNIKPKQKRK